MKNMAFDTLNKLTILEICNKLSFEDLKINVNSFDLFYDYNNHNNKTEKRKEKIIVLTKKRGKQNYQIQIILKIIFLM